MSVAEAVSVLKSAKEIHIAWSGGSYPIDPDNTLAMDAYGKYQVKSIKAYPKDDFELEIAMQPIKMGESV